MSNIPTEKIQVLLKELVEYYDKEDRSVRERQIRSWRKLKLLWEGFSRTWYDSVAHDWRIWDEEYNLDDTQQSFYDKPIDVFRAYLESIIAALSVTVPPIKCYPDDADNPLDIMTARAGDKACHLIDSHNNLNLKWLHALFTFCTEGMTACYLHEKTDAKYGTYRNEQYEDTTENHQFTRCPSCGYDIDDQVVDQIPDPIKDKIIQAKNEYNPTDVELQDELTNISNENLEQGEICPNCLQQIIPQIITEPLIITRLVGVTDEPKSRIEFDVNGGLYVKVPNYARNQADCPYLIYSYETNFVNTFELFDDEDNYDEIRDALKGSTGPRSNYEEWARLSPQYNGEYPKDVVTVRQAWLRPCAFNRLDKKDRDLLLKKYPNGVKVTLVNEIFGTACNEDLDDHWTVIYNPLANQIHFDPLGLLLVSVQELTNDLISLMVQTIEHGIPQSFADPGVLNFNAYRQLEAVPGGIYEATPKSGKSVSDAFYEIKTATFPKEGLPFLNQLQSLGQVVSGALPSIFGGSIEGSNTASEYSMSRAQALQRLQNTWKIFSSWWKDIHAKAVPMFLKTIKEDERNVQRKKDGSFFNVYIRKAELEGKIGKVELEANENLPITWGQRKDLIMTLLQAANPQVLAVLAAPENLPIIREAIGLDDFVVPGEDDRNKQYDEIKELLNSAPIVDEMGQELPSVEVDQDYDDHQIQFEICRSWVVGEAGRMAKIDNPEGFKNVLLHGKMHLMLARMEVPQQESPNGPPGEKTNDSTMIGDNSDVQTTS